MKIEFLNSLLKSNSGASIAQIMVVSGLLSASILTGLNQNEIVRKRTGRSKEYQTVDMIGKRIDLALKNSATCQAILNGQNPTAAGPSPTVGAGGQGINTAAPFRPVTIFQDLGSGVAGINNGNNRLTISRFSTHGFDDNGIQPAGDRTGTAFVTVFFQKSAGSQNNSVGNQFIPYTIPILVALSGANTITNCFSGEGNGPEVQFCQGFGRSGGGAGGGTFQDLICKGLDIYNDAAGPELRINGGGAAGNVALNVTNNSQITVSQSANINGNASAGGNVNHNPPVITSGLTFIANSLQATDRIAVSGDLETPGILWTNRLAISSSAGEITSIIPGGQLACNQNAKRMNYGIGTGPAVMNWPSGRRCKEIIMNYNHSGGRTCTGSNQGARGVNMNRGGSQGCINFSLGLQEVN